jgi:two-component system chemotaxis sensor kinase CheA
VSDIRQKLLGVFEVEQKEHLAQIRSLLEHVGASKGPSPELDEAFRRAHSLKGAARAVDLRVVEMLAHRLETLFSRLREGALAGKPVVEVIQQVLDAIEDAQAGAPEESDAPEQPQGALRAIDLLLALESEPSIAVTAPAEKPAGRATGEALGMQPLDTVRLSAEALDGLLRSVEQLSTETLDQSRVTEQLGGLSRSIAELEKEWSRLRAEAALPLRRIAASPEFSRVGRCLEFMDGQLRAVSSRARELRQSQQHSQRALQQLSQQLQEQAWSARIVPAESIFDGFRKMVRTLAQDQGKQVEFHAAGFDVEADRMVLQALKDSLMHLLRNAVCHGIEPPEQRLKSGKTRAGNVRLQLEARGNRLSVVVEDDGWGIDLDAVLSVAVRKGLLSESDAHSHSAEELARLVLQPGFSTSPEVTDLSGRGMGLSVVHEQVRRLQGDLDLQHQKGQGTRILLAVPLSVSSSRFLLVDCRGQTLAVPVHAIERLCRIEARDIQTVGGGTMFSLQGRPVPLTTLEGLLDLAREPTLLNGKALPVMVLKAGNVRLGIVVSALLGQRAAIVKDLGIRPEQAGKSAGGILLEDGRVAVVLDVAALVETARRPDGATMSFLQTPGPPKKPPTILVVDDSITTRSLEKTILESQGYAVRVAVDGVEALAQLRAERADLVITDIQMPRMDGYALLEEIKKDKQLADIPVIVVTSMERREDQERGLALGADAYVVKRKFDQRELLEAIRQIV